MTDIIQSGFNPTPELVGKIMVDHQVRREVARNSHAWFFAMYFSHYITYATAPFQKEMFDLTQDDGNNMLCVVAFRGSGKSTIFSLSYPIWSVVGKPQKKFVVLLSQTMEQAKQQLRNIREELEHNSLLRRDLGPFREENDGWRSSSLVIPKYNARIMAASSEQSIRGIKHNQHRPDLIILDDVEDINSTKTKEGRDKTYQWVTGDVIPLGDKNTKRVIIGNLLHEDSLIMRVKKNIEDKRIDGVFRSYPLLDYNDQILWPGKYSTMDDVEKEHKTIGDEISWQREYLLHIVYDKGRVVLPEYIKYFTAEQHPDPYDEALNYRLTLISVDPAISEKETADKTSVLVGRLFGYEDKWKLYIYPIEINERMPFPTLIKRLLALYSKASHEGNLDTKILIENVGFQAAIAQQLKTNGCNVEAVSLGSQDKFARLQATTSLMLDGRVLFLNVGLQDLVTQLVNFGVERYDDLADAYSLMVNYVAHLDHEEPFYGMAVPFSRRAFYGPSISDSR